MKNASGDPRLDIQRELVRRGLLIECEGVTFEPCQMWGLQ